MSEAPNLIDVFEARATPAFRRARPAITRARAAWGERRVAEARIAALFDPPVVGGIGVGARVLAEVTPGLSLPGTVMGWRRLPAATVADVAVDPHPEANALAITRLTCPRHRLQPLIEDAR